MEFAIKQVNGRKPVVAHVSETGTAIAAALARHAEQARRDRHHRHHAVLLDAAGRDGARTFHPGRIGGDDPVFLYNAPDEMQGAKVNAELCLKLIAQLPNFAGVVDLSLDWQFMIELMTDAPRMRPGFQLLAGTELMVSASAIGATGMLAPLAGIAPRLVRELYDLCRDQKLFEARKVPRADRGVAPGAQAGRRRKPQGRHARHGSRLRRAAAARTGTRCRRLPEAGRRARCDHGAARRGAGLVTARRPFTPR